MSKCEEKPSRLEIKFIVGKKFESKWMGQGTIIEIKSDNVYAVELQKQIKIIHFDKLKICMARQIPQWEKEFPS